MVAEKGACRAEKFSVEGELLLLLAYEYCDFFGPGEAGWVVSLVSVSREDDIDLQVHLPLSGSEVSIPSHRDELYDIKIERK